MALTDFFGWTEAELLAALRKAQNDYAAGSAITAAGAGDVSSAKLVIAPPLERIRNLQQALYELDPDTYEQFGTVGATVTLGRFATTAEETES